MTKTRADHYRCPESGEQPTMDGDNLVSKNGHHFAIEEGVPNLVSPPQLSECEAFTQGAYDRVAEDIDFAEPDSIAFASAAADTDISSRQLLRILMTKGQL